MVVLSAQLGLATRAIADGHVARALDAHPRARLRVQVHGLVPRLAHTEHWHLGVEYANNTPVILLGCQVHSPGTTPVLLLHTVLNNTCIVICVVGESPCKLSVES